MHASRTIAGTPFIPKLAIVGPAFTLTVPAICVSC